MSRTEDLLRETLRERAEHTHHAHTPMSAIVSRAAVTRRQRRVVMAVTAGAAIAAVAVPVAVVANRDHTTGQLPSTTLPTPSPTPTAVSLFDLPMGHRPRLAYLDGDVFVSAEGNRTTLPVEGVDDATPYHGGFLVVVQASDGPRVVLLDNQLHEVWRRCGQGGFAVSADRLSTVFVTGPCDEPLLTVSLGTTTGMGEGEQSERLPREIEVPVGVLDGAAVTSALPDEGGWITDFSGESHRIPALGLVAGVSELDRAVSGQLEGQQRTGAVVDVDSGGVLWTASGWFLERFSPDGSKVLGLKSSRDGAIVAWAAFDARSGDLVSQAEIPAGFEVHQVAWEDDEHLLMPVTEGSSAAMVRTDLDGAAERATDVTPDNGDDYPLAPRP